MTVFCAAADWESAAINDAALEAALRALIPYDLQRRLDASAPARWTAPTGSSFAIDYAAEGGPRLDVRVQELFGLGAHPAIGRSPDQFERLVRAARHFVADDKAKVVYISAWNEWTEDHFLLPDAIWGYSYLEALRRAIR